jgi:hypothetical protein
MLQNVLLSGFLVGICDITSIYDKCEVITGTRPYKIYSNMVLSVSPRPT